MECLGGNGYVEDGALARLYREAPVNAIWEGSGNVMALDVLRALRPRREAARGDARRARARDRRACRRVEAARSVDETSRKICTDVSGEADARAAFERWRSSPPPPRCKTSAPRQVAEAFARTRLSGSRGRNFGTATLDAKATATVLGRALPGIDRHGFAAFGHASCSEPTTCGRRRGVCRNPAIEPRCRVDLAAKRARAGGCRPTKQLRRLHMKTSVKPALVLGLAGAMALGSMTASEARLRPLGRRRASALRRRGDRRRGVADSSALPRAGLLRRRLCLRAGLRYDPAYGYGYGTAMGMRRRRSTSPRSITARRRHSYPYSDNDRYSPYYGGYNSNYTGPLRERTLQGRDY